MISNEGKFTKKRAMVLGVTTLISIVCLVYAFVLKQELKRAHEELDSIKTELAKCSEEVVVSRSEFESFKTKVEN
jgi:hypothetical protein